MDELTLTTNGSQLTRFASELHDCGVRRINVSIDTLDPDKFAKITRWGDLPRFSTALRRRRRRA
jgi:cyclic pyranopterin phosphate synthase